MTVVDVVISFATSAKVEIGDYDRETAFGDDFPWKEFDDALVEYLDSLPEEELRELYREPEAIAMDDPIFGGFGDAEADVEMEVE